MPTEKATSKRRVIGVAIAVGVATAVVVELVGHLAGGAAPTSAAAGGAIVIAGGIGAALTKTHKQERPRR